MKTDGRILLAAAVLGVVAAGPAWATCATDSLVADFSVTQSGPTWTYVYFVQNGCAPNQQQLLTHFYIPYFGDAGIANITVPAPDNSAVPPITWAYSINAGDDLFGLGHGAGVIDFQVTSLTEAMSLPSTFRPLIRAAPTTMAVPCWSSWKTGMFMRSRSLRST